MTATHTELTDGEYVWLDGEVRFGGPRTDPTLDPPPEAHETLADADDVRQFAPRPEAREAENPKSLTRWCACCPTTIAHDDLKQRFCKRCAELRAVIRFRRRRVKNGAGRDLAREDMEELREHEEQLLTQMQVLREAVADPATMPDMNQRALKASFQEVQQRRAEHRKAAPRKAREAMLEISKQLQSMHLIVFLEDVDELGRPR